MGWWDPEDIGGDDVDDQFFSEKIEILEEAIEEGKHIQFNYRNRYNEKSKVMAWPLKITTSKKGEKLIKLIYKMGRREHLVQRPPREETDDPDEPITINYNIKKMWNLIFARWWHWIWF